MTIGQENARRRAAEIKELRHEIKQCDDWIGRLETFVDAAHRRGDARRAKSYTAELEAERHDRQQLARRLARLQDKGA